MRKTALIFVLVLALLATVPAVAEETPDPMAGYVPGLDRAQNTLYSYKSAQGMVNTHGATLENGVPMVVPEHPQPLNVLMVTHEDCDVGINLDGMYKVRDKGLVESITKYLVEWEELIFAESGHAIRFVDDPDDADILLCACQTYDFYGTYGAGTYTCSAYSSTVTLEAIQLTHPENRFSFSAKNEPGNTITTNGGSTFWMYPPKLEGTKNLENLVGAMLGWYGYGARNGDRGDGVKAAQQALIDRGFLEGTADGSFGPKTEAAVKALQAAYGIDETGRIDRRTLVALFYDDTAVEDVMFD